MNNKEALLKYIEATHMGAKGQVIDSLTGKPITNAKVSFFNE